MWEPFLTVYLYQITMWYTLHLHIVVFQLCLKKARKNRGPSPWNLLHHHWYWIGSFFLKTLLEWFTSDFSSSQFNSGDEFWWPSCTRESGPWDRKETTVSRGGPRRGRVQDHREQDHDQSPASSHEGALCLLWSYLCRHSKEVCMEQRMECFNLNCLVRLK